MEDLNKIENVNELNNDLIEKIIPLGHIYSILNKVNGKIYVGSTSDIKIRQYEHFRKLRNGIHINKHLQSSFNKYGEENFTFEVLQEVENCTEKELLELEQSWCDMYKRQGVEVYNVGEFVTNPMRGRKHSNETKIRMGVKQTGRKHSEETKNKMSLTAKNMSNEHKNKIRVANTGKIMSDEARAKLSDAFKGEKHPQFGKTGVNCHNFGKTSHMFGKSMSEDAKAKIRLAQSVKVLCHQNGKTYASMKEASLELFGNTHMVKFWFSGKAKNPRHSYTFELIEN